MIDYIGWSILYISIFSEPPKQEPGSAKWKATTSYKKQGRICQAWTRKGECFLQFNFLVSTFMLLMLKLEIIF